MRSGQLRHALEVQRPVESRDTAGDVTTAWATVDTIWASVEPLRGTEAIEAARTEAQMTHKVKIRTYDGLDPTYRFKHGTRALNIVSVADWQERGVDMEVMCKEVVA